MFILNLGECLSVCNPGDAHCKLQVVQEMLTENYRDIANTEADNA